MDWGDISAETRDGLVCHKLNEWRLKSQGLSAFSATPAAEVQIDWPELH